MSYHFTNISCDCLFQEFENACWKFKTSLWIKSKLKSGERTVAAKKIMEKASVKYCCVINPARRRAQRVFVVDDDVCA